METSRDRSHPRCISSRVENPNLELKGNTMAALSTDTHPKMEALQIQLWRQASPTRKMNMLAELNSSARMLALAGLRSRYPKASQAMLRRKLADLLLGEELARKVYGEAIDAE